MSDGDRLSRAFILHVRKYRDTSAILELLTEREGRVAAVARGVRAARSKVAGHVRPFAEIYVSWLGRGDLKTVKKLDFPPRSVSLTGDQLMMGLYVNELLIRLLGKHDPVDEIFVAYRALLLDLEAGEGTPALRRFELLLLTALGYGISFDHDAESGDPIEAGSNYRFAPEQGFLRVAESCPPVAAGERELIRGHDLKAIVDGQLEDPAVDRALKRVVRSALNALLGGRPLRSRELFLRPGELS